MVRFSRPMVHASGVVRRCDSSSIITDMCRIQHREPTEDGVKTIRRNCLEKVIIRQFTVLDPGALQGQNSIYGQC